MKKARKQYKATSRGRSLLIRWRDRARAAGRVEGTSYGTPAFKVGKNLFVRQHQDGESLVVKIDHDQRSMRMKADPETFYITDHYLNYPWILVRLAKVEREDLRELLGDAWQLSRRRGVRPSAGKR